MRRRLTFVELVLTVGLLYCMLTLGIGVAILNKTGWSWRVVAPDGWYSLLAYGAAVACAVRTWRYRRRTSTHNRPAAGSKADSR